MVLDKMQQAWQWSSLGKTRGGVGGSQIILVIKGAGGVARTSTLGKTKKSQKHARP